MNRADGFVERRMFATPLYCIFIDQVFSFMIWYLLSLFHIVIPFFHSTIPLFHSTPIFFSPPSLPCLLLFSTLLSTKQTRHHIINKSSQIRNLIILRRRIIHSNQSRNRSLPLHLGRFLPSLLLFLHIRKQIHLHIGHFLPLTSSPPSLPSAGSRSPD